MTARSHAERIIALLEQNPELNDDEIAEALFISPRQTVNQLCRKMQARGILERRPGPTGKLVNSLVNACRPSTVIASEVSAVARMSTFETDRMLAPERFEESLLIIPCSKAKLKGGQAGAPGPHFSDKIAPDLAGELNSARERVAQKTTFDESALLPAWRRYDGSLYQSGAGALHELIARGMHVVIVSGGYGVVLADEPIGQYDQALKISWWPDHLLQRVLLSYASSQGIRSVRAFSSATSSYFKLLSKIRWNEAGVQDALLFSPEVGPGGTLKSPASIGEAIAELAAGNLRPSWRSSYGLGLDVYRT